MQTKLIYIIHMNLVNYSRSWDIEAYEDYEKALEKVRYLNNKENDKRYYFTLASLELIMH